MVQCGDVARPIKIATDSLPALLLERAVQGSGSPEDGRDDIIAVMDKDENVAALPCI